jgi:membrane-associated phospholipid phosphatase
VPGPSARRTLKRSQVIRRKLWETHSGLAGLALSVAAGFFITQGLKNLFGKPRPHLIALCQPDLADIARHVVGGYGQDISARWTLVTSSICQQRDSALLDDGFRSFPSGHSSFSWSGLLYLALFTCSKFAIAIPYISVLSSAPTQVDTQGSNDTELLPLHHSAAHGPPTGSKRPSLPNTDTRPTQTLPLYNQAAAPPNYGLILVLIPLGVAAYITSTRYVEFWHFGFDILSGAVIGILSAWFSFRWYHLPIRRGGGWAWGPRSHNRAFAIGVGVGNYVGPEGWEREKNARRDIETGRA